MINTPPKKSDCLFQLHRVILLIVTMSAGCSSDEQLRQQRTMEQIAKISAGEHQYLHNPVPSLVGRIVNDPACQGIEVLSLTDPLELSDVRFQELNKLKNLWTISFYCTRGTDTFLANLSGMKSVTALQFDMTDLSDSGIHYIAKFPSLRTIEFIDEKVSEKAMENLKVSLPNCEIIDSSEYQ